MEKKGEWSRAQVLLKQNAHRRRGRNRKEGEDWLGSVRLGGKRNNESPFYMYFF